MATYKIADFIVELKNKYDFTDKFCKNYLYDGNNTPDFSISVTEEEIEKELAVNTITDRGYAESVCIYRKLCLDILSKDAILLHAAVVNVDDKGYAFLARSGVGKSTHTRLWQEMLGDRLTIVNGDKPIVRFIDGKFYAYGTPWCGKEGFNTNTKTTLDALCFIERSEENFIEKQSADETVKRILKQVILPTDVKKAEITLDLLDKLVSDTPAFCMHCNVSLKAAEICYNTLKNSHGK